MKRMIVLSVLLVLTANLSSAKTPYDRFIHATTRKQESYFQKLLNVFHETPFDGSYAIIIAVGNYDTLPKLDAVKYDADKMKTFLLKTAEYDEVVVLKDADAAFEAIRYFMDVYFPKKMATGRHRFFFYFSGHGTQREGARGAIGYLQLKEATKEPNLAEIDMDQIENWANKFRYASHILFLLDCCFSGLAGTEDKGYQTQVDPVELARKNGRFMITAGGADETSIASVKDWGGSLFTDVAISGMNGDADTNNDGVVTTYELFTYIQAAVVNEAKRVDHPQTPILSNLGKTTDKGQYFFVYRNPETLLTPEPMTTRKPTDEEKKGAEPTPIPVVKATATPTPPVVKRLRSEPLTVSENEAQKVFGLDATWRPQEYIENDFEVRDEVVVAHATGLMWQKSGSSRFVPDNA